MTEWKTFIQSKINKKMLIQSNDRVEDVHRIKFEATDDEKIQQVAIKLTIKTYGVDETLRRII